MNLLRKMLWVTLGRRPREILGGKKSFVPGEICRPDQQTLVFHLFSLNILMMSRDIHPSRLFAYIDVTKSSTDTKVQYEHMVARVGKESSSKGA